MRFCPLRTFAGFAALVIALHLPAATHAQEMSLDVENARYIEIADAGESDGSSDSGANASDSNSDSDSDSTDGDSESGDPNGSNNDQQSGSDESGGNKESDKFDGPNGALRAVQADRALPLDSIVAIARRLTKGEIIDTRLRPVKGALQYELKVLETNNEVRRYSFNALTGALLKVR